MLFPASGMSEVVSSACGAGGGKGAAAVPAASLTPGVWSQNLFEREVRERELIAAAQACLCALPQEVAEDLTTVAVISVGPCPQEGLAARASSDETKAAGDGLVCASAITGASDACASGHAHHHLDEAQRRMYFFQHTGGGGGSAFTRFAVRMASHIVFVAGCVLQGSPCGLCEHSAASIMQLISQPDGDDGSGLPLVLPADASKSPSHPTLGGGWPDRLPAVVSWRRRGGCGEAGAVVDSHLGNVPASRIVGLINWPGLLYAAPDGVRRGVDHGKWGSVPAAGRLAAYAQGARLWAVASALRARRACSGEDGLGPEPFFPTGVVDCATKALVAKDATRDARTVAAAGVAGSATSAAATAAVKAGWFGLAVGGHVGAVAGAVLGAAGGLLLGTVGVALRKRLNKGS